jgi:hypothetical protein
MDGGARGIHDYARIALGLIRLANGLAALLAPTWLLKQLGAEPAENRAAPYIFRMFGIRTAFIGVALLLPASEERTHAVDRAVAIHASDTLSAAIAGLRGYLPPRAAIKAVIISGINTALAVLARPPRT